MKKLFVLFLALLLCLIAVAGCNTPPTQSLPGISDKDTPPKPPITDDDYDIIIGGDSSGENNPPVDNPPENNPSENNPPVDNPPVDNPPTTEAPEGSQVPTGFVAKQKKYNYGENNIVMLNVTNQNTDNYSVKVEGYYLDADGKVLKTETKFVEGYAAGYVKDFLFNPGIAFDGFKFTLTAEKFSGECYEDDFYMKDVVLRQGTTCGFTPEEQAAGFEVTKQYPCLWLDGSWGYSGSIYPARVDMSYIIINSNGDVHLILDHSNHNSALGYRIPRPNAVNSTIWYLYLSFSEEDVWPKELRDGYQILFAFTASETEE